MILYDTLADILRDARDRQRHIRFINGQEDENSVSFADVWKRAIALLGELQNRGMRQGDELIIFTRSNEDFVIAFWASVLGGIVPVPVAVGISDEHRFKLFRILKQMQHGTLYTEKDLLQRLATFASDNNQAEIVAKLSSNTIVNTGAAHAWTGEVVAARPEDIAFIQYSSGSTSDPKGVCLSHFNLCTNLRAIVEKLEFTEDDQSLSWMPLTHDMGLIGYHLSVLAAGMNHAVMDTSVFVRRPLLWMSKANELRATQLCSPNFGYKHFLKLFERKGLPDLDLSCVKLILNGAEPISWDLCEEFLNTLAPYGLKRQTMLPVYGLAEATVAVTIPALDKEYSRIVVDRHKLRIGSAPVPAQPDDPDAVSFIIVGAAVRDVEIRIVDDTDGPLADGLVGHIQARGGSITRGLYNNPEAEAEILTSDAWLRTGDVGVIVEGELVITGRSKDIIIINGQNYYPHDIEETVAELDQWDLGKVVVCGVMPADGQTEQLLIFLLYRQDLETFPPIAHEVRNVVGENIGLEVDHVIPVSRIPKTTSGKVQRAHLARDFADGVFDEVIHKLDALSALNEDEPSEDPLVRELVAICKEYSKDRAIGPDENLFESGVSSLTLTEIMLAVDEKYPGQVDINDLFDYPTIRELAGFIRSSLDKN